jgi:histidyl-tRNA synthetase
VDYPLTAAKVGKQFQTAEQLGASRAVLVGDEWPQVKVKTLATREEVLVPADGLVGALKAEHPTPNIQLPTSNS